MMGEKGAVHVAFGEELELDSDEPEKIATAIDAQILANYRLQDINYLALQRLLAAGNLTRGLKRLKPQIFSQIGKPKQTTCWPSSIV